MPKDYQSFCLVAAHLVKNAHRYYSEDVLADTNIDVKKESVSFELQSADISSDAKELVNDTLCRYVNQQLRTIRTLKRQNRIREQQDMVIKLKEVYGSYRSLTKIAGVPLKTIHAWCSPPKDRVHKATSLAKL